MLSLLLRVLLLGALLASAPLAVADPLGPQEAAQLAGRILEGRVWLVHAIVVRVIDGDTVVLNLDLGTRLLLLTEPSVTAIQAAAIWRCLVGSVSVSRAA